MSDGWAFMSAPKDESGCCTAEISGIEVPPQEAETRLTRELQHSFFQRSDYGIFRHSNGFLPIAIRRSRVNVSFLEGPRV